MTQLYYKVTDFEGIDNFFFSKKEAIACVRKLLKEADDLGLSNPDISFDQFELPKIPKKQLVLRLLGDYQFMTNVVGLDINKYK